MNMKKENITLNKIYCEDCLKTIKKIPNKFIDLIITSPPYDDLRDYEKYDFFYKKVLKGLYRITKKGGIVVWVINDRIIKGSKTGNSLKHALYAKTCGFNIHDYMIWNKGIFTSIGSIKTRYCPCFDFMFIFSKGKPKTFNPIKDRKNKHSGIKIHGTLRLKNGKTKSRSSKNKIINEYGQRFNIWEIYPEQSSKKRTKHPAVFPEKLVYDHLISWSNEGDIIYDPFLGSGTTAKIALENKRNFIGSEISKEYVKIAQNRIRDLIF